MTNFVFGTGRWSMEGFAHQAMYVAFFTPAAVIQTDH